MLDLYHVDDTASPLTVEQQAYLGSLTLQDHASLRCIWNHPHGIALPFFDDTHLLNHQVERMVQIAQECHAKLLKAGTRGNIVYQAFATMLAPAVACGHGIIAVCD